MQAVQAAAVPPVHVSHVAWLSVVALHAVHVCEDEAYVWYPDAHVPDVQPDAWIDVQVWQNDRVLEVTP